MDFFVHPSLPQSIRSTYLKAGGLLLLMAIVIAVALLFQSERGVVRKRVETFEVPSRFYYITIATKPHPVLDVLEKTVASKGEEITVLGMQEQRDIGWDSEEGKKGNFGVKLREVYDFINRPTMNPDDIVLFSDAYDVYYCGDKKTILERYAALKSPIVFGAERFCWPDADRAYPPENLTHYFPYLNSGLFIGRVDALRECMKHYKYDDKEDDQRFWTNQYMDHPELIKLDHNNRIFLNCTGTDKKEILISGGDHVTFRDATPQLVHANSSDKTYLDPLLQYRQSA